MCCFLRGYNFLRIMMDGMASDSIFNKILAQSLATASSRVWWVLSSCVIWGICMFLLNRNGIFHRVGLCSTRANRIALKIRFNLSTGPKINHYCSFIHTRPLNSFGSIEFGARFFYSIGVSFRAINLEQFFEFLLAFLLIQPRSKRTTSQQYRMFLS